MNSEPVEGSLPIASGWHFVRISRSCATRQRERMHAVVLGQYALVPPFTCRIAGPASVCSPPRQVSLLVRASLRPNL